MADREGKLIDARFLRALSDGERTKMEDHLTACGWCRERYRKLHLADRVIAFGADGELDQPAPAEVDRIAQDLGLLAPDRPRRSWWWSSVPFFGAAAAVALAVVLFVKPSEELVERGGGSEGVSFSAYAIGDAAGPRLLETGASVRASEHLKLRAANAGSLGGVDVLLVAADGRLEHVHLAAPEPKAEIASIPGAIALSGLAPGTLTAYVVAASAFELEKVDELAKGRAPPGALAEALGAGASVERIDLEVEAR